MSVSRRSLLKSAAASGALAAAGATFAPANGQTKSSINSSGALQISTGTNNDLSIIGTGNALVDGAAKYSSFRRSKLSSE